MDSLSPKIEDVIDFTTRLPVGKISFKSSFSCFQLILEVFPIAGNVNHLPPSAYSPE